MQTAQGERKGLIYRLPNGKSGILDERWTITGDGEAISVVEEIHHRGAVGKVGTGWYGHLRDGFWVEEARRS